MSCRTYPVVGFGISLEDLYGSFTEERREDIEAEEVESLYGIFDRAFIDDVIDYDGDTDEGIFFLMYATYPWQPSRKGTKEKYIKYVFTELKKEKYFTKGYTFEEFMKLPWSEVSGTYTG